jgi:REP element-mobilizing transposase RayT
MNDQAMLGRGKPNGECTSPNRHKATPSPPYHHPIPSPPMHPQHLQWSDRGYMPHVEGADLIQHVSYHLADSLPKEAVEAMDQELKSLPPKQRDIEKEQRVAAYQDEGKGRSILRVPELAEMVQETFLHFVGDRYHLHAWCVMPNHVHVLFQPMNGWTMSTIISSWKSFTGRRISAYVKVNGMPEGLSAGLVATLGRGDVKATLGRGEPSRVWHREYWDRYIRDHAHYTAVVNYIHQNPVKAKLVGKASDWKWSSAYSATLGRGEPSGE